MSNNVIIINLQIYDKVTGSKWQTFNHDSKDKKDNDWHRNVKPEIIKRLDKGLKEKGGYNCDIKIENDEIIIVSQKIDDDGNRTLKTFPTNIDANNYFEKVIKFTLTTIIDCIYLKSNNNLNIHIINDGLKTIINIRIIES